jgi:hypothetical protein
MKVNQQTLINFYKAIIFSYPKLLFTESHHVTLSKVECKTEIVGIILIVKSNVPKDGNGLVPYIIHLDYQLAYSNCISVEALSDGLLAYNNLKRKIKIEIVYLTIHGHYLIYATL